MVYAIITALIFGAIAIAGAVVLICNNVNDWDSLAAKISGAAAIVAGVILFFFIPWSFHTIDAGEIAVVKHMGNISGTRTPGTYFDFWMTETYQMYDAKVQNVDIVTATYSSDAQTMDIEMTIQYQIRQDKVKDIASNYGSLDTLENRIESVSITEMKSVLAEYTATEIIAQRAQMSPQVASAVQEKITDSYCVTITTVVLTDISFSDAFEQAVENQMIAEREKEAAITRAEQQLETSRIEADAKIAAAKGEAEAQKIAADAAAYEASIKIVELARTLGYTVTSEDVVDDNGEVVSTTYTIEWGDDVEGKQLILRYIQYLEYLSKWNGKLPDVLAGDSSLQLLVPAPDVAP